MKDEFDLWWDFEQEKIAATIPKGYARHCFNNGYAKATIDLEKMFPSYENLPDIYKGIDGSCALLAYVKEKLFRKQGEVK